MSTDYTPPPGYYRLTKGVITRDCELAYTEPPIVPVPDHLIGELAENIPSVIVIRRIPAEPVAETDYPAGLPPGLVKVDQESEDAIKINSDWVVDAGGRVMLANTTCLVCHWCFYGGKSAVYRAPAPSEVHPGEIIVKLDSRRVDAVTRAGLAAGLGGGVVPEAKPPADHIGDVNGMVKTCPLCIGKDAFIKNVRAERDIAQNSVDQLTAENTRLAGELEREKAKYERLSIRHLDFSAMVAKQIDENKAKYEAELARLKAPVDVEEFAGITPGDWTLGKGSVAIREAGGEKRFIARTYIAGEYNTMPKAEQEANALAISKLPRLLREVVELRARVKELETPMKLELVAHLYHMCRLATPEEVAAGKGK